MTPFDFALSGEATRTLLGCARRQRRQAEHVLDLLVADPLKQPDFRERIPSGRDLAVLVVGDVVVTYWVDQAEREVRVVRIEFVQ
jgi:hypothetical protein